MLRNTRFLLIILFFMIKTVAIAAEQQAGSALTSTGAIQIVIGSGSSPIYSILGYQDSQDHALGLYTNGDVQAAAYLNLSDQRLKQGIMPITGAVDKVERLNGVSFTWKNSGVKDIGLTAQNVEGVLPEIVKTGPDGMKTVEYGNIVGLLVEAIKEQQKEIDALKNQLSARRR